MTDEMMVKYLLSRRMYLSLCKHKGFEPRPQPYVDPAMMEYAHIAVEALGYDEEVLDDLEKEGEQE